MGSHAKDGKDGKDGKEGKDGFDGKSLLGAYDYADEINNIPPQANGKVLEDFIHKHLFDLPLKNKAKPALKL